MGIGLYSALHAELPTNRAVLAAQQALGLFAQHAVHGRLQPTMFAAYIFIIQELLAEQSGGGEARYFRGMASCLGNPRHAESHLARIPQDVRQIRREAIPEG